MITVQNGDQDRHLRDAPVLPRPGRPTLAAKEVEEDGVKVWLVWCKYCRRWHAHGPGKGHRVAHCKPRTPYTATGYNLALAGAED